MNAENLLPLLKLFLKKRSQLMVIIVIYFVILKIFQIGLCEMILISFIFLIILIEVYAWGQSKYDYDKLKQSNICFVILFICNILYVCIYFEDIKKIDNNANIVSFVFSYILIILMKLKWYSETYSESKKVNNILKEFNISKKTYMNIEKKYKDKYNEEELIYQHLQRRKHRIECCKKYDITSEEYKSWRTVDNATTEKLIEKYIDKFYTDNNLNS